MNESTGKILGTATGVQNSSYIGKIDNKGLIRGYGDDSALNGTVVFFWSTPYLIDFFSPTPYGNAIFNNTRFLIDEIENHGIIQGAEAGIANIGFIGRILNHELGVIEGGLEVATDDIGGFKPNSLSSGNGIRNLNSDGIIEEIVNYGTIKGRGENDGLEAGILNRGTIGSLHNAQHDLSLEGALPQYYGMIAGSSNYGKINFFNSSGSTLFDISPYSDEKAIFADFDSVMAGIDADSIENDGFIVTRIIQGGTGQPDRIFSWRLVEKDDNPGVWDLKWTDDDGMTGVTDPLVLGELFSLGDTRLSLVLNAQVLGFLDDQSAISTAALSHDCSQFGANRLCVSAGGTYSAFTDNDFSEFHGFIVAAVRPFSLFRIGGYIDQRVGGNNESAGIVYDAATPMLGGLAGYGEEDGSGLQVKVSGSYHSGDLDITREKFEYTEAGSGQADFDSWAVGGQLGYGVSFMEGWLATPFIGYRKVRSGRGQYEEEFIDGAVDFPITYDDFSIEVSTAFVGLQLEGEVSNGITLMAAAALERDVKSDVDAFRGSSAIDTLEEFSFEVHENENRTRLFGAVGLDFDVSESSTLRLGLSARELSYSESFNITTSASFTAGF